ncbi:hypothetical protein [Actinomycetospora sp. TBRC 11914]|uniref:hypothetical protein n=1 Tax=Actinomycetospora sp. TBRC 11914 TaxID=2729387 RepID=UPI00145D3705|nr:hypothetical protein [Actinomycetospora sp. TBRC 11914]NMO88391.1 hypothetical protein [Actinomycetospora sp. TBRC 11914]
MSLTTPPLHPDHRAPKTTSTRDRRPPPTPVPSPSARVHRRDLGQGAGVVFTVAGAVGAHDAAVLSRCLHAELADCAVAAPGDARRVIVVDLTEVETYGSQLVDLLAVAEDRAGSLDVGLHVLELGRSGFREDWENRHTRAEGG